MNIIATAIPDVKILDPRVFGDERGFFVESFQEERYGAALAGPDGVPVRFVQDNVSRSDKGVLRGLHFQRAPHAQGKLVAVLTGAVWDVAVDIRPGSPTYGQHVAVELTAPTRNAEGVWHWRQFWIPPGFAHGFLALADGTTFVYKCTDVYAPDCDGGLLWNDVILAIPWPLAAHGIGRPQLSAKDAVQPTLATLGISN